MRQPLVSEAQIESFRQQLRERRMSCHVAQICAFLEVFLQTICLERTVGCSIDNALDTAFHEARRVGLSHGDICLVMYFLSETGLMQYTQDFSSWLREKLNAGEIIDIHLLFQTFA